MEVRLAQKFRLYPSREQRDQLERQFGSARFVFNHFLRKRQDLYKETGENLTFVKAAKQLTELKNQPEFVWLKEAPAQALQQSLRNLDAAYANFFKGHNSFPKFKKKHSHQSVKFPEAKCYRLDTDKGLLSIPKIKNIKCVFTQEIKGETKSITVSKTPTGKYFVSVGVVVEIEEPQYIGGQIGIDLGLKDFLTTSEGEKVAPNAFLRKSEKRLVRQQRKLSRKKKGSSNRSKQRLKVAKIHERIANQRNDFLHKLSTRLVRDNQAISLEDLNVKGMIKNHKLAKSINDASWSEFVRQLEYKGQWHGCYIHMVDRWFPSSKTCSSCGAINDALKLNDRHWECSECNSQHDRDVNAAINILKNRAGTAQIHACGDCVRQLAA